MAKCDILLKIDALKREKSGRFQKVCKKVFFQKNLQLKMFRIDVLNIFGVSKIILFADKNKRFSPNLIYTLCLIIYAILYDPYFNTSYSSYDFQHDVGA